MKREKEEKIMGPMFPKLHVNDTTDKRGPRAPPRNKMALYEQLSLVNSSIQGVKNESDTSSSHNRPTRPHEVEKKIKNLEDDDFTVPIFSRPVPNNQEKCPELTNFNHLSKFHDPENSGPPENGLKQEIGSREEDKLEKFATDRIKPVSTTLSTVEKAEYKHDGERWNTLVMVDNLSENSVVDSIPGRDITYDDVVGIIGQKHFWKARREMVNQQRIFAIQVFELHRLIKVQKLIAASPHLLLEGSAYYSKPRKVSAQKRKPLNIPVKESLCFLDHKDQPDKNKTSVENAFEEKPSFANISDVRPVTIDSPTRARPWGFNTPPLGNQWLIPVMSPSEGLVYKPYPGPGFVGPSFGEFGPPRSNLLTGSNFPNPYQFSSFPWAGPHGYFPMYGMPIMNLGEFLGSSATQMNRSPFSKQISDQDLNLSSTPGSKNRASSEDVEAQASIASSSVERDNGESKIVEERNVLPLFPTSPTTDGPKCSPRAKEPKCPVKVIKVVPHNARSASESAVRIFQAIQEGRKTVLSVVSPLSHIGFNGPDPYAN